MKYEELKNYIKNKTIFTNTDIWKEFKNENKNKINTYLGRLVDIGEIKRYTKGIYGVGRKTFLGIIYPSEREVINEIIINKDEGVITGAGFFNNINLSTQVPSKIEVLSNYEFNTFKSIYVYKSKIKINKYNKKTIQFLEGLKQLDKYYIDCSDKYLILYHYLINNINISQMFYYAKHYYKKPILETIINIYERGYEYESTLK